MRAKPYSRPEGEQKQMSPTLSLLIVPQYLPIQAL
jgi:hypothetical protein